MIQVAVVPVFAVFSLVSERSLQLKKKLLTDINISSSWSSSPVVCSNSLVL